MIPYKIKTKINGNIQNCKLHLALIRNTKASLKKHKHLHKKPRKDITLAIRNKTKNMTQYKIFIQTKKAQQTRIGNN